MLSHVTFTGWDRHTDLAELDAFLMACPQDRIEVAVLHSSSRIDEDRYPDVSKAIDILRTAKGAGQRAAVHLCGRIAQMFMSYRDGLVALGPLLQLADRVQVNVSETSWPAGPDKYRRAYELARTLARPVIVQTRGDAFPDAEDMALGAGRMMPFLFDRSGGRGEEPTLWPEPPGSGLLVGYAGGLGPGNAAALVGKLAGTRPHARFWIDMESGIRERMPVGVRRSDDPPPPTYVSIGKCRQVVDAVSEFFGP